MSEKATSNKKYTLFSLVATVILVSGAMLYSRNLDTKSAAPITVATTDPLPVRRSVSAAELTQANGKNGMNCYVAVDGTVYSIKDAPNWKDGQHTTSQEKAYCGADMSDVIKQSPHGRKILDQLEVVGQLKE